MRVNEAPHLDKSDVNLENAILTLKNTKNGMNRQLPVNEDTVDRLAHYAKLRDRLVTQNSSRSFVKEDCVPTGDCGVRYNFAVVSKNIDLRSPQVDFSSIAE